MGQACLLTMQGMVGVVASFGVVKPLNDQVWERELRRWGGGTGLLPGFESVADSGHHGETERPLSIQCGGLSVMLPSH